MPLRAVHRRCTAALLTAGVALVFSIACRDATGPDRAHPAVGTYDVVTTLTSLTSRMLGSSTTVPSGPAALSGAFVVGNSAVVGTADTVVLPQFTAALDETACDGTAPTCAGGVLVRSATYHGSVRVTGDTMGITGFVTTGSGESLWLQGRVAGDSIVGSLNWYVSLGGALAQYYSGTFRAQRRP